MLELRFLEDFMHAYSQDLRNKVIEIFKQGKHTRLEISNLLKIGYKTIKTWIAQYNNTGNCQIKQPKRIGRLRAFDNKELVLEYLKKHPDASGKEMQEALAPNISDTAFYNSLARMNITYKKKRSNTKNVVRQKEQSLLKK
jgi:transposase